jgi:hypothetical protein
MRTITTITEGNLYTNIVKPRLAVWGDHSRIENAVSYGLPDISYAIKGTQGWLELKVPKDGRLYFQPFQLSWMKQRVKHTNNKGVWVLACDNDAMQLYRGVDMSNAPRVPYKRWITVDQDKVKPWVAGRAPWPWSEIRVALMEH